MILFYKSSFYTCISYNYSEVFMSIYIKIVLYKNNKSLFNEHKNNARKQKNVSLCFITKLRDP